MNRTYTCIETGCENEARSPRGSYSRCEEHRRAHIEKFSGGTASPPLTQAAPPSFAGKSYEATARQATRDIAAAGRRLDRAKATAAKAAAELREAQAVWERACRALAAA